MRNMAKPSALSAQMPTFPSPQERFKDEHRELRIIDF